MGDLEQTGKNGVQMEQVQSWAPLAHQQCGDGTAPPALPRYYVGAT